MNIKMPGVATSHLRRGSALLALALSLVTGLSVLVVVPRASGCSTATCSITRKTA